MKVLLCHFSFATIGGAERVALHIAQYLHTELNASVDILCFDAPENERIARQFGIKIGTGISFVELKSPFKTTLQLVRIAHVHREARKIVNNYDLCISTYNEQDFGFKAIQYVHHPIFESREILRQYSIIPRINIIDRVPFLEKIYYSVLNFYSKSKTSFRRKNITITNSEFMSGILKKCGYNDVHILYPGFLDLAGRSRSNISGNYSHSNKLSEKSTSGTQQTDKKDSTNVAIIQTKKNYTIDETDGYSNADNDKTATINSQKKHQIISLGRIEPDKHTLELVRLYNVLHEVDPSLKLIICGLTGSEDYLSEVKSLIQELEIPVELVLNQDRATVQQLIYDSKYYINPKPYEHFGIATVEAIELGCIPLVHNSGGNQEIVSYNVLRFENAEKLRRNFIHLNNDATLQNQILSGLTTDLEKYSSVTFFKLFHEIIRIYLIEKGTDIGPYKQANFT